MMHREKYRHFHPYAVIYFVRNFVIENEQSKVCRFVVIVCLNEGKASMADLNSVRFDLFQQLVLWLSGSMHGYRRGRHYLETNLALLQGTTDRELTRLIEAEAEDKPEMKQQMQRHRLLLQDARQRGGTVEAIREAYVNMYGGFALDLPIWLEEIEQQRHFLNQIKRPERTRNAHISLLQSAFALASYAPDLAPEITAELQNEMGLALLQGAYQYTQEARQQALQKACACHEAALSVYTRARYPLQYAKTQIYLGTVYQQYALSGQFNEAEQAIACYQEALQVYTFDSYPEQWLLLQTSLGAAYLQRVDGDLCDNIEQAIAYQRGALQHVLTMSASTIWATIQTNLGDAYRQRIIGERAQNLEQAMICYRAALQIFTRSQHPIEWAGLHMRLASVFQELVVGDAERWDKNLSCAIVCYEGALQVYTPDAYLVERAATLVKLAKVHRMRPNGDRRYNLDQAARCYRTALQVFTSAAFPTEYRQALYSLSEVEVQRQEWLQTGPVSQHRSVTDENTWNDSYILHQYK